jgi:hypothetical protein
MPSPDFCPRARELPVDQARGVHHDWAFAEAADQVTPPSNQVLHNAQAPVFNSLPHVHLDQLFPQR